MITIDQINEWINRGQAASALLIIATILLLIFVKKETDEAKRKSK